MADREVAFMDYDQENSESSLDVEQSLPTPESAKASAALSKTTTTTTELSVNEDVVPRNTSFGIDHSLPSPEELGVRDFIRRRSKRRWITAAMLPFVILVAAGTLAFFIYARGIENEAEPKVVETVGTAGESKDGTFDDDVLYGMQAEEDYTPPATEDKALIGEKEGEVATKPDETADVEPPVEFATIPPTVEATNAPESFDSRLARITAILSPVTNLTDQTSPQYRSIVTLADAPEPILLIPTDVSDFPKFIQHYVIVLLYYTLGGATWTSTANFFITGEECDWNDQTVFYVGGVFCKDGEVTSVYLPQNNVKGTLPTEIGLLSSMKLLRLNSNELSGNLPSELSKLTNLVDLQLNHNFLTGTIPTLFNNFWKDLEILNFANNLLTGTVPNDITTLHKSLAVLALDDNLLEGSVADSMGALTELAYLYLEQNGFNDTLNDGFLIGLDDLMQLDLSDNKFNGDFPPHLLQHDNLTLIDLHDNQITNFPSSIPINTVLGFLALHNNNFSDEIPISIVNLRNLEHLDLSDNQFSGDISPFLAGMTTLTYLFLANNPFSPGIIPEFLTGLTRLNELSLKNTSRIGTIPATLSQLTELVLLDLDRNSLEGTIPSTLSEIEPLTFLLLNRNNLTGTLPPAFANSSVILLLLDRNQLEGNVTFLCDGTANSKRRDVVVLDCGGEVPEISCAGQCCTCCDSAISLNGLDLNGTDADMCDDTSMLANLDPTWEHGFGRLQYDFDVAAWTLQGFY